MPYTKPSCVAAACCTCAGFVSHLGWDILLGATIIGLSVIIARLIPSRRRRRHEDD